MFELALKIIGYLPHEFLWIYVVFILVFFAFLVAIIMKLLGVVS